jgi:hypothetical protein
MQTPGGPAALEGRSKLTRKAARALTHRTDTVVALGLFLIAIGLSFWGLSQFNPALYSDAGMDLWFQADTERVFTNMTQIEGFHVSHYRDSVHPLFSILVFPITNLFILLGLGPLTAAKAVVALIGGLTTVSFFAALRQLVLSVSAAAIFTGVFLSSATYVCWYSIIETYPFAGLSICTMLMVTFRLKPTPLFVWALASAFTLAITTTNWMLGLAATFFKLPFRTFALVSACAFLLVMGFALVQKQIFPSSVYFFTTHAVTHEWQWTQIAMQKEGKDVWRPLDNLKSFFVYGAVAPHHQISTDPKGGVTNRALPLATLKPLGPAIALWLLLFTGGVWGIFRNKNLWATGAALACFIAGQAALHSFYGEITFLYVADFFPVLLAIAACAYFTPMRKLWLAAAVALVVINATGNIRQFSSAVQTINATLSSH